MRGPGEFAIEMDAMAMILTVRGELGVEAAYYLWEAAEAYTVAAGRDTITVNDVKHIIARAKAQGKRILSQ